ncbi:hypothetical protein M426DRAFT_132889 [Hypoxylon sp. CI-4A]|nr:hypothetical protein M426DRAFT_132889 [Hypoxylon sp. CI-4A]
MADQLAMTAPGSPGTTAESHSRLARMAALSYVHHQDFAGMDHMDVNLPMPANQQPGGDRIELWYRRDDGPWTPPGLASPHGNIRIPSILSRSNPLIFPGPYRESIHRSHDVLYRAPSECDTVPAGPIPSDSGYGSYGTKHSVANESVCEEPLDRSPETQSLLGHLGDLSFPSFNHEMMPKGAVNPGTPWMQPHQPSPLSMPVIDRQRNLEASKTCGICHKVMRTKSELK